MKLTALPAALSLLLSAVLLVGCSSAPPADGGSYESATALKDALVKAGGTCDDWDPSNKVKFAKSSGTCGQKYALTVFNDDGMFETWRDGVKQLGLRVNVGKNWAISGTDEEEIQKKLGGEITEGK